MQSSTNSTVNRSPHDSSRSKSNTSALRVIPLGGLHEIGKNTCVFEYGDELMLVDAGLAFPSDGKARPASTSINSSPYSNTQVFFPISCKPPNGITLRVWLLLLDPDELFEDLLMVGFDLDCII